MGGSGYVVWRCLGEGEPEREGGMCTALLKSGRGNEQ
jgi:hypothetical protein